jgi:hypothetical protein
MNTGPTLLAGFRSAPRAKGSHQSQWCVCRDAEVYLLWAGEIDEIDNKARIRKGNLSERLDHVKIKLMSET